MGDNIDRSDVVQEIMNRIHIKWYFNISAYL
jgi:hypothetical protein